MENTTFSTDSPLQTAAFELLRFGFRAAKRPACHVLAAVVPRALHHGPHARVPYREPLRRDAVHEGHALRGAVERRVADDDVLRGLEGGLAGRVDHQGAAAQALAEVVLRVALQLQQHALHREGAEGLARGAEELQVAGARGQAGAPALEDPKEIT